MRPFFERLAALAVSKNVSDETAGLNESDALCAVTAVMDYHRAFNNAHRWRGNRYLGACAGKTGSLGESVIKGWKLDSIGGDGAVISNGAPFYRTRSMAAQSRLSAQSF